MKIQDILNEWKEKDCFYDDHDIHQELKKLPILHQKYYDYFMQYDHRRVEREKQLYKVHKDLYHYYKGRGDKPFNTKLTSHTEVDIYIKSDDKYQVAYSALQKTTASLNAIKSILDQLKNRHYALNNHIELNKFLAGQ